MCFYLRNWQVTFLLYTLGVFISEYTAKAFTEPRDYRVVFLVPTKLLEQLAKEPFKTTIFKNSLCGTFLLILCNDSAEESFHAEDVLLQFPGVCL